MRFTLSSSQSHRRSLCPGRHSGIAPSSARWHSPASASSARGARRYMHFVGHHALSSTTGEWQRSWSCHRASLDACPWVASLSPSHVGNDANCVCGRYAPAIFRKRPHDLSKRAFLPPRLPLRELLLRDHLPLVHSLPNILPLLERAARLLKRDAQLLILESWHDGPPLRFHLV